MDKQISNGLYNLASDAVGTLKDGAKQIYDDLTAKPSPSELARRQAIRDAEPGIIANNSYHNNPRSVSTTWRPGHNTPTAGKDIHPPIGADTPWITRPGTARPDLAPGEAKGLLHMQRKASGTPSALKTKKPSKIDYKKGEAQSPKPPDNGNWKKEAAKAAKWGAITYGTKKVIDAVPPAIDSIGRYFSDAPTPEQIKINADNAKAIQQYNDDKKVFKLYNDCVKAMTAHPNANTSNDTIRVVNDRMDARQRRIAGLPEDGNIKLYDTQYIDDTQDYDTQDYDLYNESIKDMTADPTNVTSNGVIDVANSMTPHQRKHVGLPEHGLLKRYPQK